MVSTRVDRGKMGLVPWLASGASWLIVWMTVRAVPQIIKSVMNDQSNFTREVDVVVAGDFFDDDLGLLTRASRLPRVPPLAISAMCTAFYYIFRVRAVHPAYCSFDMSV